MYMASEQTNRKPLKGWAALGAPPSLAGQRKPLLSPHLTETHQIPDGTIVRTFLGLFPSLLLMKSTELQVSPISVFSKMGNRKSNLEATKGESFYHGAEWASSAPTWHCSLLITDPAEVRVSDTECISEKAGQQNPEMDGGAECWWRHRVKNPKKVLVPFPFNEPEV